MLPEIWARDLNVIFVGTTVAETSDQLGFYYLGPNNRFWSLLEYAGITPASLVSPSERKVLVNAQKDGVLNDTYKQLFFEKKERELLKHRIGLTDLNRRRVVSNDDDPAAEPTKEDILKFVKKAEKYAPKVLAFVTSMETFEKCLKPLYPSANRQRGKQDFLIGNSEVWLLGSSSGRVKDTDAMEQVFEDLAERLKKI
ncbi:MAG: mismatch-specific DNA-glycosylase [Bacteroidota bacterium]